MVQGLGLGAFTARAYVWSLVGELRCHKLGGVLPKKIGKKDVFTFRNVFLIFSISILMFIRQIYTVLLIVLLHLI